MSSALPVLISIPHGGTRAPEELEGRLCITERDRFDDSDPFTTQIYDLGDAVRQVVKTDIARTFVDPNRSLQDMPPRNPDGLIKSATCYRRPIYKEGLEPDGELSRLLIRSYYMPYHRQIQRSLRELDIQVGLDCHSMAPTAPDISPDGRSKERPIFCLSNQDGRSSSAEMIEGLADCISESFSADRDAVSINDPFHGEHITRTYGNDPVPWIQVEMNRSLYLDPRWFNYDTLQVDRGRLRSMNQMFGRAVAKFCEECFG